MRAKKWRGSVVISCAFDGRTFLFLARVGISAAGGGYCAFHSPAAGYLLDFYHTVFGVDRSRGLHRRRNDFGRGAAPRVVSGVAGAAADSVAGTGDPGQSFGGEL